MTVTPVGSSSSYHHGDLANACVAAALDLMAQRGIGAVTLRDVAAEIGVSRSAPYRHFADKQALLAACAACGFNDLTAAAERVIVAAGGVDLSVIRQLLLRYAEIGSANPSLYRLMFASEFSVEHFPALEAACQNAFDMFYRAVADGQAAGTLATGDTYGLVLLLWSCVHGLVSLCNDLAPSDALDTRSLHEHTDRVFQVMRPALDIQR